MSDQVIRPSVISEQKVGSYPDRARAFQTTILDVSSMEDIQCIYRKLVEKAKEGNLSAIRLVVKLITGLGELKWQPRTLEDSRAGLAASPSPTGASGKSNSGPTSSASSSKSSSSTTSGLTVDEVFAQPLTREEMQAARVEGSRLNGLNGEPRTDLNQVNGGATMHPPAKR